MDFKWKNIAFTCLKSLFISTYFFLQKHCFKPYRFCKSLLISPLETMLRYTINITRTSSWDKANTVAKLIQSNRDSPQRLVTGKVNWLIQFGPHVKPGGHGCLLVDKQLIQSSFIWWNKWPRQDYWLIIYTKPKSRQYRDITIIDPSLNSFVHN